MRLVTIGLLLSTQVVGIGEVVRIASPPISLDSSVRAADSRVRSQSDAVEAAISVVGPSIHDAAVTKPQLMRLVVDDTPFLASALAGKVVWHVEVQGTPEGFPANIKGIHVLSDAETGQLVKVYSDWPPNIPRIPPQPDPAASADQMRRSGDERYHGLPPEAPTISFSHSLAAIAHGGGSVDLARQVVAVYVMWSRMGKWMEPRAVWAITLRGVPPVKPPPGSPEAPVFSYRYIVDGTSGDLICGTNVPEPEPPREYLRQRSDD